MANAFAGPESQAQPRLQLNEHNCSILELLSNDTLGRKTQAIPIKTQRCLEISDAKSDYCDTRFHVSLTCEAERQP
jgi:hypothetical protein